MRHSDIYVKIDGEEPQQINLFDEIVNSTNKDVNRYIEICLEAILKDIDIRLGQSCTEDFKHTLSVHILKKHVAKWGKE